MSFPRNIVQFATEGGSLELFELFKDYFRNYRADQGAKVSYDKSMQFSEKEEAVNKLLLKESFRLAGLPQDSSLPLATVASNPSFRWATFAIVSILIDAVLPETIIDSIGAYTDVRTIGYGDSATFDITPRDLFFVSKAGRSMRQGQIQQQFSGAVSIIPEMRELTTGVALYRVLAGVESLARFTAKAIKAIETEVTLDAYNAFATAMAALTSTAGDTQLQVSGWSRDDFVRLAQKVGAWGGAKPILMGTQRAIQQVLPDDANYRYDLESDYAALGYVKNSAGFDTMVLNQVADWRTEFAVSLADDKLWIIAPAQDKIVKLVLEGSTMANTGGVYENADLTQQTTLYKMWGTGIATTAMAATIDLA